MNEPMVFDNPDFGSIRTVEIDSEPWFVLNDICEAFGEKNYRRVSSRLDNDEKGVSQISTLGGNQNMTIVNEPGLYSALFYMQPEKARNVSEKYIEDRKKQLKKFKRWVTSEVLPSIRKTGGYAVPTTEKTLADLTAAVELLTERLDTMLAARESPLSVLPALPEPEGEIGQVPGIAARRRWMRTVSEKLDMLSTKIHQPHNICLHQIYQILEDRWQAVLEDERIKVMEQQNLSDCSVLTAIFYNSTLKDGFQKIVDFNLAPENRGW